MEFLYRLYSNDYFGIGLFIVITILAFSFLVILFFGKKDEKARKEELNNNEINNNNVNQTEINAIDPTLQNSQIAPTESLESISLPNNTIVQEATPIKQEVEQNISQPVNTVEPDFNPFASSPIVEEPAISNPAPSFATNEIVNPIVEDAVTPQQIDGTTNINTEEQKEENFESNIFHENPLNQVPFASTVTAEPIITPSVEKEDIPNAFSVENSFEKPVITEPVSNDIFSTPIEEPIKRTMPTQFSSVYVNKEPEIKQAVEETPVETNETITPMPAKPEFELPKPFDLPKLNQNSDTSSHNEAILKTTNNTVENENLTKIFGNFEEDSYTINE